MAWKEYMLVRDSDLYDGKGLAKPLLTLIAMLIIGEPEMGPNGKPTSKPDEDAGWCVARQDYLAMALGCSEDEVSRLINKFERGGWIKVNRFRAKGHKRNHYALLRQKEIAERKSEKDEDGYYIRAKNPNRRGDANSNRDRSGRFNKKTNRILADRPTGTEPSGQPEPNGVPIGSVPVSEGFRKENAESGDREIEKSFPPSPAHTQSSLPGDSVPRTPTLLQAQDTPSPRSSASAASKRPPVPPSSPAPKVVWEKWTTAERDGYFSQFPEEERKARKLETVFAWQTGKPSSYKDFQGLLAAGHDGKLIYSAIVWAVRESNHWEFHNSKHFCKDSVYPIVAQQYEDWRKKKHRVKGMSKKDADLLAAMTPK